MAHLFGSSPMILPLLLWIITLISFSQGKVTWEEKYPFIKNASTFSKPGSSPAGGGAAGRTFDYIIIGGGTAGCPLVTTLSQSNYSVLLLERGGVPFTNVNVTFLKNFHISLTDDSPASAAQMFISTDGVINSRARVLGGGTCINAGFYTRANRSFIRDFGWDEKLVNESYRWVEKQIVQKPVLAPMQKAVRDGLLEAGVLPFNGFTFDHVFGTKVSGTIFDRSGRRHTAAELLASANPDKLSVLIRATVQKIVFDTRGKRPKAVGVIFKDENGKEHKAYISRRKNSEIILSSGAIGTPQLLILSGIGPKDELQKFNISTVLRNEFVGKGMVDNPQNAIFIPLNGPVEKSLIQTVGITKIGVYIEASSGFGQSRDSIKSNHGNLSAEAGRLSTISPKSRTLDAVEAYRKKKKDVPYEVFQGGFILEKIARPLSSGGIRLINTNVDDNPSVTFNYFSHPSDLQKCVNGIRLIKKIVNSKSFKNFSQFDEKPWEELVNLSVQASVNLRPKQANDTKFLDQFCKDTVVTIWHYHGGCHVGKVVDNEYKVLGVDRLRVVDGSVFNESPGTNPSATVMMMGRYKGVKIIRDRLRSERG